LIYLPDGLTGSFSGFLYNRSGISFDPSDWSGNRPSTLRVALWLRVWVYRLRVWFHRVSCLVVN
jgi:hypothetical protein